MELSNKKSMILECIKLGMDFYTSALSVSCTKDEIKELEEDDDFQRAVEITNSIVEKDLLENHEIVIEKCVENGIAAPIQWKLERLNPNKWGSRTKVDTDKPLMGAITVNLVKATEADKKD